MGTISNSPRVLYQAKTHTTGGREHGISRSSDGNLEVNLTSPASGKKGTNPEQLFAAGWSACFEGAMALAAQKMGSSIPDNTAIDAAVDLCFEKGQFFLQARMEISLPGVDSEVAMQIVAAAQEICPYSKAVKGNIVVEYNLV